MLRSIAGKPLIQWAHEQACRSNASEVIVATDDDGIRRCCEDFGATVCMTGSSHRSGSDRVAEVASKLGWGATDVVVNLQGDEPLVEPALLDALAACLWADPGAAIATVSTPIWHIDELDNPNVVKVVCDAAGRALYFSRAAIPSQRDGRPDPDSLGRRYRRHVGLYAYRVEALERLAAAPASEAELAESLEQLRALHLGMPMHVMGSESPPAHGVDVETDIPDVERALLARDAAGT